MSATPAPDYSQDNQMITSIEPDDMNNNNTNMIVSHQQHLHSSLYQLLHTAVGQIGDERVMYYEHSEYIEDDSGTMLAVE